jgi:glycerol-3-phosphate acyltransferase PlsX
MEKSDNNKVIKIAVDAMGGDNAPRVEIEGAIAALKEKKSNLFLFLVGKENLIRKELEKYNYEGDDYEIVHAEEVITMHDSPARAVKTKKNSSLVVAANLVKEGRANALVSAGNTGAVAMASILIMGRIPGVSRPTIASPIPTEKGTLSRITDAGAFVDSRAEHLLEFAKLTDIYLREVHKVENPTVGLLNVGEEESKGHPLTYDAFELLKNSYLNFKGNVEGKDVFKGTVDIVVCDGFVGNIILKFAESVLPFLKTKLKQYADKGLIPKLQIGIAKSAIKKALVDTDPNYYGGIPLLGINGVAIIGHGSSNAIGIKNMIFEAARSLEVDLVNKIKEKINA